MTSGTLQNWKVEKLGSICETTSGGTPSRKQPEFYNGNIPWIKSGELDKGLIVDSEEKITPEAVKNSSAKVFPKGTLLIALYGATIGKLAFLGIEAATNQAICGIFKNDKIDQRYLYNYLFFKRRDLINQGIGGAQPNISQTILKNLDLPLPPPNEQHQIVDKIEELFSELDKGIENLKTAQQQLKVYRQAVLKWAFEGKLTNENVKDGELPEGWELVKTKDVIGTINNGYTPTKEFLFENDGEIPFIKVYNLNFNGTLNFNKNPTFIPKAIHLKELKRSICEPGDVLINIVGPPLGKVSIVTALHREWNINQAIVLFKPNNKVLSKYISYFLQNPVTINWLEGTSKATAGQWNVKVSTCREIPFPICSIAQQELVVQKIESRLSVCDKIEETINTSLQQAEALRQSILKKAFEGKLVKMEKQPAKTQTSIEIVKDDWKRKVLAGHVLYSFQTGGYIGRTKLQKILYLCEQHAQLDYETDYIKEAAGPLDSKFLYAFLNEAKQKNWAEETIISGGYKYEPSAAISELTLDYPKYFRSNSEKIKFVIKLLKEKDTDTSELIATIYAIWNNYLIERKELTGELLIAEVYEWDGSKVKFDKRLISSTWQWMKEEGLVPVGFGKLIIKAA